VKLGNDAGTAQSGRSIAAGYRLEAYATLILSRLRRSRPEHVFMALNTNRVSTPGNRAPRQPALWGRRISWGNPT